MVKWTQIDLQKQRQEQYMSKNNNLNNRSLQPLNICSSKSFLSNHISALKFKSGCVTNRFNDIKPLCIHLPYDDTSFSKVVYHAVHRICVEDMGRKPFKRLALFPGTLADLILIRGGRIKDWLSFKNLNAQNIKLKQKGVSLI